MTLETTKKPVEILDVLMGSGKTHAGLRYIENMALEDPNARWIFCTVFLDDIDERTGENPSVGHLWVSPTAMADSTKTDDLITLLSSNKQLIAISHSLLLQAYSDQIVRRLIESRGYSLFLDETLDLINPYDGVNLSEFQWHMDEGRLKVDNSNNGKVVWTDSSVNKYEELSVDRLVRSDRVYAGINGKQISLVNVEDANLLTMFSRVIISTYSFEGTVMAAWMAIHKIAYIPCKDITCFRLTKKSDIRKNITMINKYDKLFNRLSLSTAWYEKATAEQFALINRTIRNIGDSTGCKGNPQLLAYTMPRSVLGTQNKKRAIQPPGYPHTKCLTDAQGKEIEGTKDKVKSAHINCNARASNDYAHKRVMIHVYDRHPNIMVANFLFCHGIPLNREVFAVNELVQWIWRSAIRNGEPIQVAILSQRMREYFTRWINSDD